MIDNKLLKLLKTLNLKELILFEDFVKSPYFNSHKQVISLFEYLKKYAPEFDNSKKLEKSYVYAQLYKSKAYDDNFFASIISKLLKLLEDFLAYEAFNEKTGEKELLTLKCIRKRKLEKHFKSYEKILEKQISETIQQSSDTNHLSMLFAEEQDRWFIEQGGRVFHFALQKQSDELDSYYLVEKLKIACDMLNRNRVSNASYECKWIDNIYEIAIAESLLKDSVLLLAYRQTYEMLMEYSEEKYFELKQLLENNHQKISSDDLKNLYGYALNFCIGLVNSGKLQYFSEILALYKSMLRENLLFIEGYLPAWEYKNIVTAALRSNDLEWAESFLENYKSKLEPAHQENSYTYNMSSFLFECSRYKEALRLLHNVIFVNPTYHIGAKIIQIKIFTESGDWDIALSSLDAFAGYLRRNKEIAEYQKKSNLNFISACRSLIQLVSMSEWKADEKLLSLKNVFKTKLDSLKPLPSGDWLQEVYNKHLT
jgi:hypothetical protein